MMMEYIETIATFAAYRGRGIATKLLTSLLESNTHVKWSLNCDINNEAALKLYKKRGFISDGQIQLYKHMYHHLIVNKKTRQFDVVDCLVVSFSIKCLQIMHERRVNTKSKKLYCFTSSSHCCIFI